MPSYDALGLTAGILGVVFSSYWGRMRAREVGGSAESYSRGSMVLGTILIAVTLADYFSILLGWGSFLGFLGVR